MQRRLLRRRFAALMVRKRPHNLTSPLWTDELLRAPHVAADKAGRVRGMFDAIAPRYALVNTVFSGGRDAYWRRRAVALVRPSVDDRVLDVACGTGDLARAFLRAGAGAVVGCDFAHQMLIGAARAGESAATAARGWVEADALKLPFADQSFSVVSCAFGVRNFADLDAGLAEMHRVLQPSGRLVILEFTRPHNALFRALYEFYAHRVMPRAAAWISGDRSGAYRYLPRSVVSFLTAEQMCLRLAAAGFSAPGAKPLTFGVVTVYVARRSA